MNIIDRAWLAGLLEGEGCFSTNRQSYTRKKDGVTVRYVAPTISLQMTDRDVVTRAARLMGPKPNGEPYAVFPHDRPHGRKTIYTVVITGRSARRLMREVLPLMGARRAARITTLLPEGLV